MIASSIPEDFPGRRPADFDLDYANFVLAYQAANRGRSLLETLIANLSTIVAVVSSTIALIITLYNASYLNSDRAGQAKKEALDNQVSLAKLYFDKLPGTDGCGGVHDKLLFTKSAVTIAGLKFDDLTKAYLADSTMSAVSFDSDNKALQSFAVMLFTDIYGQSRSCTDGVQTAATTTSVTTPTGPATIQLATRLAGTTYDLRQQMAAPAAPKSAKLTAYIQYKKGDAKALAKATALEAALEAQGYTVHGSEGVAQVPTKDQIRLYKSNEIGDATKLIQNNKDQLGNAEVVDLSKAYPKLPEGVLEIWLAASGG